MGHGIVHCAASATRAAENRQAGAADRYCERQGAALRDSTVCQQAVVGSVVGGHDVLPIRVTLVGKNLTGMWQSEILVGRTPESLFEPGAVAHTGASAL